MRFFNQLVQPLLRIDTLVLTNRVCKLEKLQLSEASDVAIKIQLKKHGHINIFWVVLHDFLATLRPRYATFCLVFHPSRGVLLLLRFVF